MDIAEILRTYKTIAVVGLSQDPEKDSYRVASYMKSNGYKIIPVNPTAYEIVVRDWSSDVCSSDLRLSCRLRAKSLLPPCRGPQIDPVPKKSL